MGKRLKQIGKLLSKSPGDPYLRGKMWTVRKEYRKLLKQKKSEWKQFMIQKLEQAEEKNPKEYWDIIKQLRERQSSNAMTNPEDFQKFYEKLFSESEEGEAKKEVDKEIEGKVANILLSTNRSGSRIKFDIKQFKKALLRLKTGKSTGPDGVLAEMLKESSEPVQKVMLVIINKIVQLGYYPKKWAEGITSLILKEGDDEDPNNYRAITVASAISKVLAILLDDYLAGYVEEKGIMNPLQIAFQKKSRPADHLLVLKSITDNYLSRGRKIYACFVDFQKAYDNVWRIGMYHKLLEYGVEPNLVSLIKDMYDKTKIMLKINGKLTAPINTQKGVRQGCILSPRLFNLFINDIPTIFDKQCHPVQLGKINIQCLMYADDIVIFSESKEGLQRCLSKLEKYTEKWKMKLNHKKTKILIFQKYGKMPKVDIAYKNVILEQVKEYKYLGSMVSRTGSFNSNTAYLKGKGLRARFLVTKTIGYDVKPWTGIKIFEKMVEPILLYNCEISQAILPENMDIEKFRKNMWKHSEDLEKVIYGFLRQTLGIHKKTTKIGILAEVGKYPISMRIFIQIIKYYVRLHTTQSTLLQNALDDAIRTKHKGKNNWLKIVDLLLKTTKLDHISPEEIIEQQGKFVKRFTTELHNLHKQYWETERQNNEGKLRFYFQYKRAYKHEEYLQCLGREDRKAVSKLRLSSHNFPIEQMRYQNTEPHERKCQICPMDEVGDEIHYLTKCGNMELRNIRSKFQRDIMVAQPQFSKFDFQYIVQYCLLFHDTTTYSSFGRYINNIMDKYDNEIKRLQDESIQCPIM